MHDSCLHIFTDDDSMRDSLAELADLLGREEEVRGEKKEEQNSREEEELPERDKLTDETRRANGQPPGKRNQQIGARFCVLLCSIVYVCPVHDSSVFLLFCVPLLCSISFAYYNHLIRHVLSIDRLSGESSQAISSAL